MAIFSLSEATDLFQQSIGNREEMFIYYYDKQENEFQMIEQTYVRMIEDDKIPDKLLDWMVVNPYTFLEEFAYHKNDGDLAYAIRGKGVFRRFRDVLSEKDGLKNGMNLKEFNMLKRLSNGLKRII